MALSIKTTEARPRHAGSAGNISRAEPENYDARPVTKEEHDWACSDEDPRP